jgi:aldehyde dehydrogenase (NAD+)
VNSWRKKPGHSRAQILYYIGENLQQQKEALASVLQTMTGQGREAGLLEVDLSIERLFFWAAYCDKYGGEVQVRKGKKGKNVCFTPTYTEAY